MLVEIGDVVQLHAQTPFFLGHDVTRGFFEFAELTAKRYLLLIFEVLVVKYKHTEAVHAGVNSGDFGITKVARQVNT
jgi:hypothetical protein